MSDTESDDDNLDVAVTLGVWQWAEVAAALKVYLDSEVMKGANNSRRDALYALREIDRVMMGADEQAPPDDLL